jgi:hypothetical protein
VEQEKKAVGSRQEQWQRQLAKAISEKQFKGKVISLKLKVFPLRALRKTFAAFA